MKLTLCHKFGLNNVYGSIYKCIQVLKVPIKSSTLNFNKNAPELHGKIMLNFSHEKLIDVL